MSVGSTSQQKTRRSCVEQLVSGHATPRRKVRGGAGITSEQFEHLAGAHRSHLHAQVEHEFAATELTGVPRLVCERGGRAGRGRIARARRDRRQDARGFEQVRMSPRGPVTRAMAEMSAQVGAQLFEVRRADLSGGTRAAHRSASKAERRCEQEFVRAQTRRAARANRARVMAQECDQFRRTALIVFVELGGHCNLRGGRWPACFWAGRAEFVLPSGRRQRESQKYNVSCA